MLKTPKPDVCEQPAYLFWKLQSRLTKLANQLENPKKPSNRRSKPNRHRRRQTDITKRLGKELKEERLKIRRVARRAFHVSALTKIRTESIIPPRY